MEGNLTRHLCGALHAQTWVLWASLDLETWISARHPQLQLLADLTRRSGRDAFEAMSNPSVSLGLVDCTPVPVGLEELDAALKLATGEGAIGRVPLKGLAGPNAVIQVLISQAPTAAGLAVLAYAFKHVSAPIREKLIDPHLKEAGERLLDALRATPKVIEGLTATSRMLAAYRTAGIATSVGVPLGEPSRNVALQIDADDPARLAMALAQLGIYGSAIAEFATDPPLRIQSSATTTFVSVLRAHQDDCSIVLELDEQQHLYIPLQFYSPGNITAGRPWPYRIFRLYPDAELHQASDFGTMGRYV